MNTTYRILFMIDLLHDYYSSQECLDFTIVPSEETLLLLKSRQMMYKLVGNKLVVLVKVISPLVVKPVSGTNPKDKFLFYLHLNKPQFNFITNIDIDEISKGKRYYFTNLHGNDLDGVKCLTQKIEPVPGAANYLPGDLAADAGNTVYECIKATNETNNPPSANFWQDRGQKQYASKKDMIECKTRAETYKLAVPAKIFMIRVAGFNTVTNDYDIDIPIKGNRVEYDKDTDLVQVKLSELLPGRYKLDINNEKFDVFIDDAAVYGNLYGIIEIFSQLPGSSEFGLLKGDGSVKDDKTAIEKWLRFQIRFPNRLAYWKYNSLGHNIVSIKDENLVYSFDPTPAAPGDKDFFTSTRPIPLSETRQKLKIKVELKPPTPHTTLPEDPLAPNPDPDSPAMFSRTADHDYYCTININY